jgi:5-methylthioadenosine/S-adenosylhomocysteine deaminase
VSPEASTDAGDGGAPLTVVPGVAGRTLLRGTILATSGAIEGEVLVEGDRITCVGPSCAASPGANGASVIETNGVISPGLIDTHNHILFDIFDDSDWLPARRYANHDEWPNEAKYQAMLDVKQCLEDASQGKPSWCPATYDGAGSLKCEMDKFGELKGIVAGTTSIVGLSGTTSACFSSVARTIDAPQNGLGQDKIQTSALFPPSRSAADGVCSNFTSARTDAYLIHVGEGVDARSLGELDRLGTVSTTPGCLYAPHDHGHHGTAFARPSLARMAAAGMKLTWSPASNIALYGSTTNIPLARAAGLTISLAPDWSMGGSQNLLDELRFADGWDNAHFGNVLTPKDLFAMVTVNAAAAVALADKIGTLAPATTPTSWSFRARAKIPSRRCSRRARRTYDSPWWEAKSFMVTWLYVLSSPRLPAARRSTSAPLRSSCAWPRPTPRRSSGRPTRRSAPRSRRPWSTWTRSPRATGTTSPRSRPS